MDTQEKWDLMHLRRRMISRGLLPSDECHFCRGEMVPVISKQEDPALRCMSCRAVTNLGILDWERMKREVDSI